MDKYLHNQTLIIPFEDFLNDFLKSRKLFYFNFWHNSLTTKHLKCFPKDKYLNTRLSMVYLNDFGIMECLDRTIKISNLDPLRTSGINGYYSITKKWINNCNIDIFHSLDNRLIRNKINSYKIKFLDGITLEEYCDDLIYSDNIKQLLFFRFRHMLYVNNKAIDMKNPSDPMFKFKYAYTKIRFIYVDKNDMVRKVSENVYLDSDDVLFNGGEEYEKLNNKYQINNEEFKYVNSSLDSNIYDLIEDCPVNELDNQIFNKGGIKWKISILNLNDFISDIYPSVHLKKNHFKIVIDIYRYKHGLDRKDLINELHKRKNDIDILVHINVSKICKKYNIDRGNIKCSNVVLTQTNNMVYTFEIKEV